MVLPVSPRSRRQGATAGRGAPAARAVQPGRQEEEDRGETHARTGGGPARRKSPRLDNRCSNILVGLYNRPCQSMSVPSM